MTRLLPSGKQGRPQWWTINGLDASQLYFRKMWSLDYSDWFWDMIGTIYQAYQLGAITTPIYCFLFCYYILEAGLPPRPYTNHPHKWYRLIPRDRFEAIHPYNTSKFLKILSDTKTQRPLRGLASIWTTQSTKQNFDSNWSDRVMNYTFHNSHTLGTGFIRIPIIGCRIPSSVFALHKIVFPSGTYL